MRTIIINRQKHITLLADHRTDPITKILLKVGDEVVACAGCKTVFLADVWNGSLKGTCCQCGGTQTTDDIPNKENITFSKVKPKTLNGTAAAVPVKKTSYGGMAFFFALIAIVLGLYANDVRNRINKKQEENDSLAYKLQSLAGEYNEIQHKLDALQKEKERISARYTEQVAKVASISMMGGIKANDVEMYTRDYGTISDTERVYFNVKQPILLKSVKLFSYSSSGYLKLKIYNSLDMQAGEANFIYLTEGQNTVQFNDANLSAGRYYISVQGGNAKLLYLQNFTAYPVVSNNLLEITGTNYPDNNLYLYYFDWEYALQSKTAE